MGIYYLTLPHVLAGVLARNEGYDEGVYVGVATRFVNGVLPYHDFVFLHPPGIALIFAPLALVGRVFGTRVSLELARCLTVFVVAGNVTLAGLLLRRVGRVASAVAAFSLALWPLAVAVDPTVELEPYLVFCCLLGSLLVFDALELGSSRRLLLGGLVTGFALTVKVWAILPLLAIALVCLPKWRTIGVRLGSAVVAGAVIPCAPFVIAAPGSFYHDVVATQLQRTLPRAVSPISLGGRIGLVSGLDGITSSTLRSTLCVYGLATLFVVLVLLSVVAGPRRRLRVEWFALVAPCVVFAGMLAFPASNDHYSYFPAAFFALLLGVTVTRVRSVDVLRAARSIKPIGSRNSSVPILLMSLCLALGVFLLSQDVIYARSWLAASTDPSTALAAAIPAGSCAISDLPADLLVADRFTPSGDGCPAVVDPVGLYLSDDGGSAPHPSPPYALPFLYEWLTWLQHATYVELQVPFSDFIPWSTYSVLWFHDNYQLVGNFAQTLSRTNVVDPKDVVEPEKTEYVYRNLLANS